MNKEELEQLIPNEEIIQEKMKYLIRDELESIQGMFTRQIEAFDKKFVGMFKEIDVHKIRKQIDSKASDE